METYPTMRTLIAAVLVVGVSFASIGQCGAVRTGDRILRPASHSTHKCACCGTNEPCQCKSTCQPGKRSPQQGNDLAVLNGKNDWEQPLGLSPAVTTHGPAAAVVLRARIEDNRLSADILSLVAQGTRLNV